MVRYRTFQLRSALLPVAGLPPLAGARLVYLDSYTLLNPGTVAEVALAAARAGGAETALNFGSPGLV